MAKPALTPREKAIQKQMSSISPKERATLMETVEKRIQNQQTPKKAATKKAATKKAATKKATTRKATTKKAATKKAKNLGQRMSDATKKSAAQSETATRKKVEGAKKNAEKATKKAVKQAKKTGAKAAVKGANRVGSAVGATKALAKSAAPLAKGVGKVAVPLAVAMEAYEAAKLLTPKGRAEALQRSEDMAEDGALSRAGNSLFSPVKTIGGAGQIAGDALLTSARNLFTDTSEIDDKIETRVAAKATQEAALDAGLSDDEQRALRRHARDNKLREFGDIRTPEEARAMYDTVLGTPEVIDEMIDGPAEAEPQNAAPAPTEAKPEKTPPKAVAVYDDELEGISDPAQPSRAAILSGDKPAPESEVDYTDEAVSHFENTHATEFDPKSSKDIGKLENTKELLARNKGKKMSANQFALQFYREYP